MPRAKSVYDFNSFFVLLFTVSIFLPFYISVAVVSVAAVMILTHYEKRAETFREPYSKFIILCIAFSFFVALVYNNHVGMVYSLLFMAILICCFYVRSFMTRQLFNSVMDTVCLCSVGSACVALLQKFSTLPVNPSYRPAAVFSNPNYYGMIVEFVVLIALYRVFTNPQKRNFYLLVLAANAIGLYLSASMSSAIALGCAVLVFLLMKGRYRTVGILVVCGVAVITAAFLFPEIFPRVEIIDQSWEQRLEIWGTAIKGIERHPLFGQGLMAYQSVCEDFFGYRTYHSHNLYLDTLLNFGFIGTGALAFYVMTQAKVISHRFRNNICSNMNVLLVAAVSAIAVHGMTDVTIFWNQTSMLFLLVFSSTGINSGYANRKLRSSPRVVLAPPYPDRAPVVYSKN